MPDICQIYALDISDRIACSAGPMAEDNKTSIMPSLATDRGHCDCEPGHAGLVVVLHHVIYQVRPNNI